MAIINIPTALTAYSLQPKQPNKVERYRSGRNGIDSKSIWGSKALTWVRIPPSPPVLRWIG